MTESIRESYCVVQTTVANAEQAESLARAVVDARLGACVQVQAVRSYYTWDGAVRSEEEQLLTIKTRDSCYRELEALLLREHPYDVPEVIRLAVMGGSAAYLAWVDSVTGS